MDSKCNEVWSTMEVEVVKSIIAKHNANNIYAHDINKKHNDIVDGIQTWFSWKERGQVIDLYASLVAEMILSNKQQLTSSNNYMNDNVGMSVEDPTMVNIGMFHDYPIEETMPMRDTEKALRSWPTPQKERHRTVIPWTEDEHRQFLQGLRLYGRGNWKNISRYSVPTKTRLQVSSHAQKYFHWLENASKKQRHSINDVGLYDEEPRALNNVSNSEGLAFANGTYKPNCYGSSSQLAITNNVAQVSSPSMCQANQMRSSNNSQIAALDGGQQETFRASSSSAPAIEGTGSKMACANDQHGDFDIDEWVMNMEMN